VAIKHELLLHNSVAETATWTSRDFGEFGGFTHVALVLDVTAVSGTTPSMTVKLQERSDQKTGGLYLDPASGYAFAAVTTAPTLLRLAIDWLYFVKYRAVATISGTSPSFTFTLAAYLSAEEPVP
jgi:hypothetical protein